MIYLYILGLLLIAFTAIAGLFSRKFDDNLLQCIGLSATAASCLLLTWTTFTGDTADDLRMRVLTEIGILLYAVGTMVKVSKHGKE